jgi:hypothetical protein
MIYFLLGCLASWILLGGIIMRGNIDKLAVFALCVAVCYISERTFGHVGKDEVIQYLLSDKLLFQQISEPQELKRTKSELCYLTASENNLVPFKGTDKEQLKELHNAIINDIKENKGIFCYDIKITHQDGSIHKGAMAWHYRMIDPNLPGKRIVEKPLYTYQDGTPALIVFTVMQSIVVNPYYQEAYRISVFPSSLRQEQSCRTIIQIDPISPLYL